MLARKTWQPLRGAKERVNLDLASSELFDNINWNGPALLNYKTDYFEVFRSLGIKSIFRNNIYCFCLPKNHSSFLSFPLGSILFCIQHRYSMCQGLTHSSPAPRLSTSPIPGQSEHLVPLATRINSVMYTHTHTGPSRAWEWVIELLL